MEENIKTDILLKFYTVYFRVSREINRLHQGKSFTYFSYIQVYIHLENSPKKARALIG